MSEKELLLIVDDSKLARLMIKGFANENNTGIEILEAANGNEALDIVSNKKINHITVDYNMPGMDGLELIQKLRTSQPNANICLLTANVQDSIQSRTKELDINFIAKPINEEKIVGFLKAS